MQTFNFCEESFSEIIEDVEEVSGDGVFLIGVFVLRFIAVFPAVVTTSC